MAMDNEDMSDDPDSSALWVFGYGSLMWRPGFNALEKAPARLTGFSRRFCVYSFHHRGTVERPGLVLGLDRGGICDGVAYRIADADRPAVLDYLREREQVSGVYRETLTGAWLQDSSGRRVKALTYIVERAHPQYAPPLPLRIQAEIIRGATGISGVNLDYLLSTVQHLKELNIRERDLERICALCGPHLFAGSNSGGGSEPGIEASTATKSAARTKALTRACRLKGSPVKYIEKSPNARFRYRRALNSFS